MHSFERVDLSNLGIFRSLHFGRRSQVLTLPSSHTLTILILSIVTVSETDESLVLRWYLSSSPLAAFDESWIL